MKPDALLSAVETPSKVTAWFWVLPLDRIVTRDGTEFHLAASTTNPRTRRVTRDDARDSLSRWYANVRPHLKLEHAPGNSFGRATGETRFLTGREAIARGVRPEGVPKAALDVESCFAQFEIDDPRMVSAYLAGNVRATSPALALGRHDDQGEYYDVANEELSVTATPVQSTYQVDARALAGVHLSAQSDHRVGFALDSAETSALSSNHETDQRVTMDPENTEAAPAEPTIADVLARVEALEAQVAAMANLAANEAATEKPAEEPAEMSALRAENAKLKADVVRSAAVVKLSAVDLPDTKRAALADLAVKHGAGVLDTFLSCLPAAPVLTTAPLSATHPPSTQDGPISLAELAANQTAQTELSAKARALVDEGKFANLDDAFASLIGA